MDQHHSPTNDEHAHNLEQAIGAARAAIEHGAYLGPCLLAVLIRELDEREARNQSMMTAYGSLQQVAWNVRLERDALRVRLDGARPVIPGTTDEHDGQHGAGCWACEMLRGIRAT